jgi:hypothetical protein
MSLQSHRDALHQISLTTRTSRSQLPRAHHLATSRKPLVSFCKQLQATRHIESANRFLLSNIRLYAYNVPRRSTCKVHAGLVSKEKPQPVRMAPNTAYVQEPDGPQRHSMSWSNSRGREQRVGSGSRGSQYEEVRYDASQKNETAKLHYIVQCGLLRLEMPCSNIVPSILSRELNADKLASVDNLVECNAIHTCYAKPIDHQPPKDFILPQSSIPLAISETFSS